MLAMVGLRIYEGLCPCRLSMGPADILADVLRKGFDGPLGLGPTVCLADSGGKGFDLRKRAHWHLPERGERSAVKLRRLGDHRVTGIGEPGPEVSDPGHSQLRRRLPSGRFDRSEHRLDYPIDLRVGEVGVDRQAQNLSGQLLRDRQFAPVQMMEGGMVM